AVGTDAGRPRRRRRVDGQGTGPERAVAMRRWLGAVGLLAFGGVLELLPRLGIVPARYLPPPSRIAGALADLVRDAGFWVALGGYAAFWQVLVQVLYGVGDVDPVARETADSYRLGRVARVRYLVWPTALPYALTGVRLATSVALVLAVTGELVIGTPGLGREIAVAQSSGAVPAMYALVV